MLVDVLLHPSHLLGKSVLELPRGLHETVMRVFDKLFMLIHACLEVLFETCGRVNEGRFQRSENLFHMLLKLLGHPSKLIVRYVVLAQGVDHSAHKFSRDAKVRRVEGVRFSFVGGLPPIIELCQ